jgi:tripartite-type tricarboxylate transporter receptor subunit TctC
MSKRLVALSTAVIVLAAGGGGARAQSFYEGKTVRLVVGFAPGGGLEKMVAEAFALDPALLAKLKNILYK